MKKVSKELAKEINSIRLKSMREWIREHCTTVMTTITPEDCTHLRVKFNPIHPIKQKQREINAILETYWAVVSLVEYTGNGLQDWVNIHLKEVKENEDE